MPDRFQGSPDQLAAYKAGQIDQRLQNHDEHLHVINGSIHDGAVAIKELVVAVAGMQTQMKIAAYIAGAFLTAWISAMVYLLLHVH